MAALWNESLEMGVREIDNQHQELFRRVEGLLEAGMQRKGKEKIGEILQFLSNYVVEHFQDEERLMELSHYPKLQQHKALHDQYVVEVRELIKRYELEGETLNIVFTVNRSVVDWLVQHISGHDRDFATYYRSRQTEDH